MLPPVFQPKYKVDQSYRKKHVPFQLIRQFQADRRQSGSDPKLAFQTDSAPNREPSLSFKSLSYLNRRSRGSQLLLGLLIGEIREGQQEGGRNAESHTAQFGGPPTRRPGQRCCEAAEKPDWPTDPGNPPCSRFHNRSAEWIVLRSPPQWIQNPYTHAQRRYDRQHPQWRKTNGD
jgi:hypothetical protein